MSQNPENQVDEALLAEVRALYTPLSVAKEEIKRRAQDEGLKKRVMDFLDGDLLPCLVDGPKAVLARQVATPNFETLYFLDLAETIGLKPVLAEFTEDKFIDNNFYKYHLARLFVDNGIGKKGGHNFLSYNIIDFNNSINKSFSDLRTNWGQNFVEFHHEMQNRVVPNSEDIFCDSSDWCLSLVNEFKEGFYSHYLTSFVCHGVLFENFLTTKEEEAIVIKRVIPAFNQIKSLFGVSPLVVPLNAMKHESDDCWFYYPAVVKDFIDNKVVSKS